MTNQSEPEKICLVEEKITFQEKVFKVFFLWIFKPTVNVAEKLFK